MTPAECPRGPLSPFTGRVVRDFIHPGGVRLRAVLTHAACPLLAGAPWARPQPQPSRRGPVSCPRTRPGRGPVRWGTCHRPQRRWPPRLWGGPSSRIFLPLRAALGRESGTGAPAEAEVSWLRSGMWTLPQAALSPAPAVTGGVLTGFLPRPHPPKAAQLPLLARGGWQKEWGPGLQMQRGSQGRPDAPCGFEGRGAVGQGPTGALPPRVAVLRVCSRLPRRPSWRPLGPADSGVCPHPAGAGVFFLSSAEGEQISFLFDCIVRGISPTKGPFGLRPLLPGACGRVAWGGGGTPGPVG